MKTSKANLIQENAQLSAAVAVRDEYLMHAFRGEVTFISKGQTRLGICGETRAHGGVVIESNRDNTGKWYVFGVHYWESFYQRIREYPLRHDDKEGQDLRTCAMQAAAHIAKVQAEFYAPKVLEAVCV